MPYSVLIINESPEWLTSVCEQLETRGLDPMGCTAVAEAEQVLAYRSFAAVVVHHHDRDRLCDLILSRAGNETALIIIGGRQSCTREQKDRFRSPIHHLARPCPLEELLAVVASACSDRERSQLRKNRLLNWLRERSMQRAYGVVDATIVYSANNSH